jgi:phage baseplate assembly protein W|tara:strand:+ start:295 stop:720 length:426 start_codon:yes stop_codon:yes gene_type:complete
MPKWDATNSNNSNRISRTFKDLDLDFGLNSVTKDVNKLTDAEAIKRSVRNLINTNNYDRPFRPEIGSGIRGLLFEPMTELTAHFMQLKIAEVLNEYEPRVIVDNILVRPEEDRNSYAVSVQFVIVGTLEPVIVDTFLERLR